VGGTCVSDRDPEADFSPNLLNSVVFLVTTSAQVATFAANYRGRPYMTPLLQNKYLLYTLVGSTLCLWCAALEVFPDLNEYLVLTKMPSADFKFSLWRLMALDLFGSLAVEQLCLFLFYPSACRSPTDVLLS